MKLARRLGRLERHAAALPALDPASSAEARAWVQRVVERCVDLIEAAPTEELAEAVYNRMVGTIEDHKRRLGEGRYDCNDLAHADGLFAWVLHLMDRDAAPLPQPLPAALLQVYLDDPGAQPFHDCGSCGLLVPTDRERHREYFSVCPMCGGATGLLLWSKALHEAVRSLQVDYADVMARGPLAVLVDRGYQHGKRLDQWLASCK